MNLSSWLKDTITVAPMTGVDSYGQPQYGEQYTIKCRVEDKLQKVVNASGQEVMSNTEIACLESIGLQDHIWLPGADTTKPEQARMPLNVHQARNKSGSLELFAVYMGGGIR